MDDDVDSTGRIPASRSQQLGYRFASILVRRISVSIEKVLILDLGALVLSQQPWMLYPVNGDPTSNMHLVTESPSKSQALSESPPLNVCNPVCRHQTPFIFFLLTPYRYQLLRQPGEPHSKLYVFCAQTNALRSLLQAVTHTGNIIQEVFQGVDEHTPQVV